MKQSPKNSGLEELKKMLDASHLPACLYHLEASQVLGTNKAYLSALQFESKQVDERVLRVLGSFVLPQMEGTLNKLSEGVSSGVVSLRTLAGEERDVHVSWIKKRTENGSFVLETFQLKEFPGSGQSFELKQNYGTLFQHLSEAYILLDLRTFIILDANDAATKLYKAEKDQFILQVFTHFLQFSSKK